MQLDPEENYALSVEDVLKMLHPDDYPLQQVRLKAHFANPDVPYISDHRYRMRDGSYRWFRAVGRSVYNEQGRLIRMAGMITDIDHERKVIEALRMSEARISTLLDNSPAPDLFQGQGFTLRDGQPPVFGNLQGPASRFYRQNLDGGFRSGLGHIVHGA